MTRLFRKRLIALFAVGICTGGSVLLLAQTAPSTQPDALLGGPGRLLSPDERNDFGMWVREWMPNLWKLVSSQPRSPRRSRFIAAAIARYKTYRRTEAMHDNDSMAAAMKSVKLEDTTFGLIGELDKASDEKKPALREKILDNTRELVDEFNAERSERISKLKALLADEERALKHDQNRADKMVADRLAHFQVDINLADATDPATTQSTTAPSNEAASSP